MTRFIVPVLVFGALVALLYVGLQRDPKLVPSPLIGKPAPEFTLPDLHDPGQSLSRKDLDGQVYLLNVWASWCVACRQEHPLLLEVSRQGEVPIYGLNYKDARPDALRWLRELGDPYTRSIQDLEGEVAIDFGVYGVPETFLIDREGRIAYKQIGPITPTAWEDEILPRIRALKAETGQQAQGPEPARAPARQGESG